ncbi:T9SS type A sorting domain-containing protein [Mucilaginibacter sp. HMF5004]|uniref:T9SS type A sorting domain-containing protein n=1 Tax=Mucilaginibacter rivuli TaxID=2857527 RepID=UPI001C5F6019|nr:T9SS type A sorting domain-containing protein [Mucilaginibacter rivuli]MBW4889981.1 T9SS type A sorting domain-containing protein [Mucilaginibacter rivuli]
MRNILLLKTPKKTLLSAMLLFSCSCLQAQTLAFPGALGFGRYATGGRTGTVYHVTNLNDSGAGSFRDAVSVSNRIVVFDVGGYISLLTAVSVKSNITIAGQTAPGGGIGFKGGEIGFASITNIICRYIRIRPGSETASSTDDAVSFYRGTNMILDHSSLAFAPWNNIDGVTDDWQNHPVDNITVQNCIIANPTGQQFGAHTEAVNGNWAWFYNIFANSHNRNPLAKVNTIFVNNVLYNCSAGYTTHTSTNFKHDIVNNYFVFGPASAGTDNTWYQVDKNQSIYYSGNLKDNNNDGVLNGATTTPYWYQGPGTILTSPWSPLTTTVTPLNTQTAFRYSVSRAGALPRDQVDALVISQVKTIGSGTTGTGAGTTGPDGSLYTSQTQTGLGNNGYGTISSGTKPTDTDNDGMPDFWETANGLSTSVNDAMTIGGDGYANIERYINWLADPHASTTKNNFVNVDLSIFAGGFSSVSPGYSVSGATNGTVTLTGSIAKFTPTTNFTGLGSFNFTVTGSDGSTYTSKVTVVVSTTASGVPIFASTLPAGSGTTVTDPASTETGVKKAIVYPNPSSGLINLKLNGYTGTQYNLNIIDVAGKNIFKTNVKATADNIYQVRLNNKPIPGEYVLTIEDAGHIETVKVIIQ